MIVIDLEGNSTNWLLTGNTSHARMLNKSKLHLRARSLLKEIHPTLQILEEIPIHVRKKELLYLDFYIPLVKNLYRSSWRTALQIYWTLSWK